MADRIRYNTWKSICYSSIYRNVAVRNIPTFSFVGGCTVMDDYIDYEPVGFVYPDEEEYGDEDWED